MVIGIGGDGGIDAVGQGKVGHLVQGVIGVGGGFHCTVLGFYLSEPVAVVVVIRASLGRT